MPLEHNVGDLGARLRAAREQKGLSLDDIAHTTKITVRALEALENGDISRLPGGIFSRSFVRAYAAEVGLNPEETVDEFVRQSPQEPITSRHSPVDDGDSVEGDRQMVSVVLRLIAGAIVVAGLIFYSGLLSRKPAADLPPAPSQQAGPGAGPGGAPAPPSDRADRLSIELVASDPCSVSVTIDSQPTIDFQLQRAGRRTFEIQHDLVLRVSDPPAISWTINGAPGRALAVAREATTVHLTLDNYRDFLNTR